MRRLIGSLLIICIFVILIGCSQLQQNDANEIYKVNIPTPAGSSSVDFELKTSLPSFPDEMQTYTRTKSEVTAKYVTDLSTKLGLTGELKEGNLNYLIEDREANISLEVYKASGAIVYSVSNRPPLQSPELPSNEEAITIATDCLNKIGFYSDRITAKGVIVGETYNKVPQSLAVSFYQNIDGKYFTGPGAKYHVRIWDKSQIVQIMANPVEYKSNEKVHIKPADQAFQELKTKTKYASPSNSKKVVIDEISIAYWLEIMDICQDYIVPVYLFNGQCFDASGKQLEDNFSWWVEAVD
jgi:hypothetical protein